MNGNSTAETLAFWIMEAARECEGLAGDLGDSPIFILGTGPCSGAGELAARLAPTVAIELLLDQDVISGFAHQLVRVIAARRRAAGSDEADDQARRVSRIATGQANFLRSMALAAEEPQRRARWGLASAAFSGDYALYFKLLFPRAKFVFLHRNPLDAFGALIERSSSEPTGGDSGASEAAAFFAENWCALAASFQLWHKDVGGLLVSHDRAFSSHTRELEAYLEEPLSPVAESLALMPTEGAAARVPMRARQAIVERATEAAARFGYRLNDRGGAAEAHALAASCHSGGSTAGNAICAVLVPVGRYIEPECDEALRELERRGYAVRRMYGASPVDHARSMLATAALEDGFDETLWIDADTRFDPDDVDRLRSHKLAITAGVYARKSRRGGLAMAPIPGTREVILGKGGGLVEVLYVGAGFLLVRREAYIAMRERFRLPLCDEGKSRATIPFFMPMIEDWGGKLKYLGEDYAFCRRARLCGYKIMADTSIRLWHIGAYHYGYEDAADGIKRLETYRHIFDSGAARRSDGGT